MKTLILFLVSFCSITCCNAQFNSFLKGYYIDSSKNVHHGLIRVDGVYSFIKFKEDKKQKAVKFTALDIVGFVIETDSFTRVGSFEVPYGFSTATVSGAFAKVIKKGEVSLLYNTSFIGYGNTAAVIESYLLQRNDSFEIIRVPAGSNKFKKLLSNYFSDCPKVRQGIENGTLTFDHLPAIVEMYNQDNKTHLQGTNLELINGF